LEEVAAELVTADPAEVARRVREVVDDHVTWRRTCLNLLPPENLTSRSVLVLLGSALATRLTEGFPGDKLFPPARQNRHIDEVEAIIVGYLRRLLRARWVEWRAVSNTMANLMALESVTEPGDRLLVHAMEAGGNDSYQTGGVPDVLRLEVHSLPPGPLYDVDLDRARDAARTVRPRVIVVGGGYFLFPLPVRELRAIADEAGAYLLYDAAHVALMIAAGGFQDPLAEGADFLTCGTHKIMGGPVGGVVGMQRDDLAARVINRTHPLLIQTRDQNKYAAAAHALAEMAAFGGEYARQAVANARALAAALEAEGIRVLGRDLGYTATHQVVADVGALEGEAFESRCQAADILLHHGRLPGEPDRPGHRSALRLSVQEVTRQGMLEAEMAEIARLIARAGLHREAPATVAADVTALVGGFPMVRWSFDAE